MGEDPTLGNKNGKIAKKGTVNWDASRIPVARWPWEIINQQGWESIRSTMISTLGVLWSWWIPRLFQFSHVQSIPMTMITKQGEMEFVFAPSYRVIHRVYRLLMSHGFHSYVKQTYIVDITNDYPFPIVFCHFCIERVWPFQTLLQSSPILVFSHFFEWNKSWL